MNPYFTAGNPLEEEVTASKLNALAQLGQAGALVGGTGINVTRTGSSQTISLRPEYLEKPYPPFWPRLDYFQGQYYVSVQTGCVYGRIVSVGSDETFEYLRPGNMLDANNLPKQFAINENESLYVEVPVLRTGEISGGDGVVLKVATEGTPGASTGGSAPNDYDIRYYKLATLKRMGTGPSGYTSLQMNRWICGSNIYVDGRNLDLTLRTLDWCGGFFTEASKKVLCWRLGDYIGSFDFGSEDIPDYVGTLDEETVSNVRFYT